MNDQNQAFTSASEEQTLKKKRGRPHWDNSISHGNNTIAVQEWDALAVNEYSKEDPKEVMEDELLGQVVSGVLSGSFDAGYFVTMKPQNRDTTLTGLVFCAGKVVSITSENDLAPQVKMYTRKEYGITNLSQPNKCDGSTQQMQNENQIAFQLDNQTPKSADPTLDNQLPSTLAGKLESKPAAALIPACDPENDTSIPLKGHDLSHQSFEFGVGNFYTPAQQLQDYRIVDQDEIMKEFEASACMNAPSYALKPSDYRLESVYKQQIGYPDNLINNEASQNQEAAPVDSCLKLKESVQFDKQMRNQCSGHVVNPGFSVFMQPINCSSKVAASMSNTPLTDTIAQQIADAADIGWKMTVQDKSFDVNKMPSIDEITGSQAGSEFNCLKTSGPSMVLFQSAEPVHPDLKLGFGEAMTTSSKLSHSSSDELPSSTYEKKNLDEESAASFFINLTDTSTRSPTPAQHPVPECFKLKLLHQGANKKPSTNSINFMVPDSQKSLKTNDSASDNPTQEAVTSELNLPATATPRVSVPTGDRSSS